MLSGGNPIYAFSVYNIRSRCRFATHTHISSVVFGLTLIAIYRPHTYLLGSLTNLMQPKYGLRKNWMDFFKSIVTSTQTHTPHTSNVILPPIYSSRHSTRIYAKPKPHSSYSYLESIFFNWYALAYLHIPNTYLTLGIKAGKWLWQREILARI